MKTFNLFGYTIYIGKRNTICNIAELHPLIHEWNKTNHHIWIQGELNKAMRSVGVTSVLVGKEMELAEELVIELTRTWPRFKFTIEVKNDTYGKAPYPVITPHYKE